MRNAKNSGKFISFDPNFRKDLWNDRIPVFIELSQKGIALANFVKVSEEELQIITGSGDLAEGTLALHQLGTEIVAVTLGSEGTFLSNGHHSEIIPSVKVKSIDSTGAGDAFVGATLYQFAKINPAFEDFEVLKKIISFSNKVGALVCTKVGAISAMPTIDEIK